MRKNNKCNCDKIWDGIKLLHFWKDEENILDTYEEVKQRGWKYWWLYISQCKICKNFLLIAQEERHNDIFLIRKISDSELSKINNNNIWPTIFDDYSNLLEIWHNHGISTYHANPYEWTIKNIIEDILMENNKIDINKLSKLLNIDISIIKDIVREIE